MATENFKEAGEIFQNAIEIEDPAKRARYLENACKKDPKLRAEVEALLRAHEKAGDYLEAPAVDVNITLNGQTQIEGPGTKIGRYELLSLIGEGGMGLVYLAEQKKPVKRRVALKIIKPGMDSKQVIARFEAERQALAMLDHPNIAHVFDAGTTSVGLPYFVMEYVKGMSITSYCDEHKLDIEQRLKLFEHVCEGIHHAHQKGIIHRDIKPSNILVSMHDDRAVPKLIDFGIAKATARSLTDKTVFTSQGQLLGTPEYMSPEQVDLATQDIDTRSDIYSLGVVLYELLAGVLPFEKKSFASLGFSEVQRTIREQEPASPSIRLTNLGEQAKTIATSRGTQAIALARRLYRELEWIPLKAMRKDRCRRYRSASEMADDIRNYLEGLPLIAGPETAVYRVQKFVHKHAGSVVTVALVAIAIVLGLIVSTALYMRSEMALEREAVARVQAEDAKDKETAARTRAEQAEEVAQLQRNAAEEQRKVAQEQRKLAEESAEDYRHGLYVNTIQLADAKYREGNISRVRKLLESCPQDLRAWEWDRINHVLDNSFMSFVAHVGSILSVSLSPDGKRLVTGGGSDRAIKVWDIATGKELFAISGAHEAAVTCVAFSLDGKRIVSGDFSGEIKVWDAASVNKAMTLVKHGNYVWTVAFSPDGKHILSASEKDEMIKVWDAATGAEIIAFNHGYKDGASCAAFSPDGKHIVSAGWGDSVIKIWEAVDGNEVMKLTGHNHGIWAISFSSDGKLLASGSGDNTIKIWDVITGSIVMTLRGHERTIVSVAFSPDNKYLVSGGTDCTVRIWDIATGEEMTILRGHESSANSVVFTPGGKQIVSGSWDGTVKVWDVNIDHEVYRFLGHRSGIASIAFSPDSKHLVSRSDDGKVKVWDVASCAEVMTLIGKGREYSNDLIAFSPDGKRIASLGVERAIVVWDAETGAEVMAFGGQDEEIGCLAFSPNGKRIVSGSDNGNVKLWDVAKGEENVTLGRDDYQVVSVAFSPDGKRIVSGGITKIKVWDVASGAELMDLIGHEGHFINSVVFSSDGKHIASACWGDPKAKIWDAVTGMELMTLWGHGGDVTSVAFSPDNKRLVTGSRDGTIRVWDSSTGTELLTLPAKFRVHCVAFSPDGKTIAGGTYGKTIVLWESAESAGGYEPRKTAKAAREMVDELYEKLSLYKDVIDTLKTDDTLDESVRKVALQIANSRKSEDTTDSKESVYDESKK